MTKDEWKKIIAAKKLLELEDSASLIDIKKAYRRLSKQYHPDLAKGAKGEESGEILEMHELTSAYHTLLDYCNDFLYPLVPGDDELLDGDDWWMDRFGQDPLWGKGGK